jgi:hypothetical protein
MNPKSILKSGRTEKGIDTESENLSYLEDQKIKKKRVTGLCSEFHGFRSL